MTKTTKEDKRIQIYFKLTPEQFEKLRINACGKSVASKAKAIVAIYIDNLNK